MLERSRPYAFTPTRADLFNNEDVNDLIDGINDAIIKALPDRQLADQVIDSIENYVAKKTDDLLHEDPKEKRRRATSRHVKESIARKRRDPDPEPLPDILDGFPLDEEDVDQYTSEEEIAADAHELEQAPADLAQPEAAEPPSAPHSPFPTPNSPFGIGAPPSGSTVTIHPLHPIPASPSQPPTACGQQPAATQHFAFSSLNPAPCTPRPPEPPSHGSGLTPQASPVTQRTKPNQFCHSANRPRSSQPLDTSTLRHCDPSAARTILTNFASPCGTPEDNDNSDRTTRYTWLPAASPGPRRHSPFPTPHSPLLHRSAFSLHRSVPHSSAHPNQPYSPLTPPNSPIHSPSQIQIAPPRPRVRRFTKRALARRLNELEMHVHQMNMAVAQVAAMLERLAAPDQPARPIGFCPQPPAD
jgi:hypothetical protein